MITILADVHGIRENTLSKIIYENGMPGFKKLHELYVFMVFSVGEDFIPPKIKEEVSRSHQKARLAGLKMKSKN